MIELHYTERQILRTACVGYNILDGARRICVWLADSGHRVMYPKTGYEIVVFQTLEEVEEFVRNIVDVHGGVTRFLHYEQDEPYRARCYLRDDLHAEVLRTGVLPKPYWPTL